MVECYFWALGTHSEPQYSVGRMWVARVLALGTLIDDTYDAYGTYEELVIFTEAIERYIKGHAFVVNLNNIYLSYI